MALDTGLLIFLGSLTAAVLFTAAAFGVLFLITLVIALFEKD